MSSMRGEDRYPLLFVVNVRGDSLEKPPLLDPMPSVRDRNVARGAATVISRWPQHVQSTSRLALFTACTILCMSFFMVAVVFYTSDFALGEGFGFRAHPKRHLAMCSLDDNMHDGADVAALVKFMTPLARAWEFLSDEDKIFFVMSQGDSLSPAKKCAIESAAGANRNSTVYLLVLVDAPQRVDRAELVAAEVAAFNGSVSVIYVDVARYLKDTPLRALRRGSSALRVLAARLVTLWRFGGLSLDVDVLSLKAAKLPRRRTKNAYVDMEGRVLSVRHPCHAYMFQAMSVLDKMNAWNNTGRPEPNARIVLQVAHEIYCRKPHCRNRLGFTGKCPGFKHLPRDFICSLRYHHDNMPCVWASITPQDVGSKYFDDVCAISSNSQSKSKYE